MKSTVYVILIGLLSLIAVNALFPFFAFSKSLEFALIFLILYSAGNLVTPAIRKFFTLPETYWASFLIHLLVNIIVFMLCNSLFGGISIIPAVIKSSSIGFIVIKEISLDVLGTIVCGAAAVASVYELAFYLKS